MTKIAIYARYSSDLQTDASIEDQIRLCQKRAVKDGWHVANCYTDHGISGASMMRPGVQMLMQDAADGKFDIVVAEALDRLSRDQEDIAGIYKRLQFAGVQMVTLAEGEISNLHIGLKGTMNAIFLKDLADKTRRGLSGRIEKGKSGGGKTYGYDVVKKFDANGEPIKGDRAINEEQANVVRRIMREYAAGKAPKAIAHQLNREGIVGPSGKPWGPSTINGNRQRGTGILNNELYVGQLVWNRQRFIKDPDTGKRVPRLNPVEEWQRKEVPELRIVDEELWDAVRARQKDVSKTSQGGEKFWKVQRPKHLFSYLLKCGCCGGGFSKISQSHYGCSTARNKGTCENRLAIRQDVLEKAVLNALQNHLLDDEMCAAFCDEYTRHINELRMARNATINSHRKELEKLAKEKAKIVDAIKNGVPASEILDDLNRIIARREELEAILETAEEVPVLIHPQMADRYRKEVLSLRRALNDEEHRAEAADLLRNLVEKIVLTPREGEQELAIDLHGDLAGILSVASKKPKSSIKNDLGLQQDKLVAGARSLFDDSESKVVAGVGFEPTTFRL
ncbi:MAG: recombinase family protein [Rhodospirillales bacterium]|nr:recombinase family protein [Rhodospirillales bacterium]